MRACDVLRCDVRLRVEEKLGERKREEEEGGLVIMSALNMAMNGNAYKMIEIKKVSVIHTVSTVFFNAIIHSYRCGSVAPFPKHALHSFGKVKSETRIEAIDQNKVQIRYDCGIVVFFSPSNEPARELGV